MIGSIAGRMQGSVENCVSYATVYGKDYVGGIIGTRDNALGLCSVSRCSFEGIVEATGTHAGGIGGGSARITEHAKIFMNKYDILLDRTQELIQKNFKELYEEA